jgi:hypothetical protein
VTLHCTSHSNPSAPLNVGVEGWAACFVTQCMWVHVSMSQGRSTRSTSSCAGCGCRHLTDRVSELPLSVAARLVAPADMPALLAALLDEPPWERRLRAKRENGKGAEGKGADGKAINRKAPNGKGPNRGLQRFERGEWRAVEDKLKLCQHDIQVSDAKQTHSACTMLLALANTTLLCCSPCRTPKSLLGALAVVPAATPHPRG